MSNYLRSQTRQYLRDMRDLSQHRASELQKSVAQRISESLDRSMRHTKENIAILVRAGWASDMIHHWIETGESPDDVLQKALKEERDGRNQQ